MSTDEKGEKSGAFRPVVILRVTEVSGEGSGAGVDKEKEAHKHALYFYGKVCRAVELLTIGPGDIKDRLRSAGMEMLLIPPEYIPEHLREDLTWVREQLTRFGEEGTSGREKLMATMHRIRRSTGVKIAQRMLKIEIRYEDWVEENSRCHHKHQE